jgi:hypothetical protein
LAKAKAFVDTIEEQQDELDIDLNLDAVLNKSKSIPSGSKPANRN